MQLPVLENPLALLGLILVVPIILLYLLKPKPKQMKFPTIMFITRMEKDHRFRFFPKRFVRDPLLLIQMLAVAVLILAIANPMVSLPGEKRPEGSIVFVLDASASMQAVEGGQSRFQKAVETARNVIRESGPASTYSIVLAENIPIVVLREGGREAAEAALSNIGAADTTTNLGDSILFAKDMVSKSEQNRIIYVISDFAATEGLDVGLVKKLAGKEGIETKLIKVGETGGNIGIVGMEAKRFLTNREKFYLTATIQNYRSENSVVLGSIMVGDEKRDEIRIAVPAGGSRLVHYEGPLTSDAHIVTVKINPEDNFPLDDTAYASITGIRKYSVLLVTDDESDTYLEYALKASPDVSLSKAVPPVVPGFTGYDTVIQGEIDKDLVIKAMYVDLAEYVRSGGNLIVLGSEDLAEAADQNMVDMLPVKLDWMKSADVEIDTAEEHEVLKDTAIESVMLSRFYKAEPKDGAVVIVKAAGFPVLAYHEYGKGKVVYDGINPNPEWSNFYYSSSMPIFWLQMIKWVNQAEKKAIQKNYKTGEYLTLESQTDVATPSGNEIKAVDVVLDEVGVYRLRYADGDDLIAVNLASEKESDTGAFLDTGAVNPDSAIQKEEIEVEYDIYPYLLGAALLLLVVELVYYAKRGYFQK